MKNVKQIIEAKEETPYAIKIDNGYELWSNDRKMKILIESHSTFLHFNNTQQSVYSTSCFVRNGEYWEHGDNSVIVNSIKEYVDELDVSPYFTKAVSQYRMQNKP